MPQPLVFSDIVENQDCDTVDEFLVRLRRSHDQWWDGDRCLWSFRGQWDADWQLSPNAFRDPPPGGFRTLLKAARRHAPCREMTEGLEKDVKAQFCAEAEALSQFSTLARSAGLPIIQTPLSPFLHDGWEEEWQRQPTASGEGYLRDDQCPDLRIAAVAQHHGVPTRLLDFTGNPLLAAFVAVSPHFNEQNAPPERIAVWAVRHNSAFRSFFNEIVFVEAGDGSVRDDEYIRAQSGRFLLIKNAAQWYLQIKRWPSVEDVILGVLKNQGPIRRQEVPSADMSDLPFFRKLTLPFAEIGRLLQVLEREEISVPHLMPTLDNVAQALKQRWTRKEATRSDIGSGKGLP